MDKRVLKKLGVKIDDDNLVVYFKPSYFFNIAGNISFREC